MVPLENFIVFTAILFALGVYGVLSRRNAVLILMSIELMLNAVSLNFAAFSAYMDDAQITGAIFTVFTVTVAAAEVGLALAIVIRLFRMVGGSDVEEAATMRW